MKLVVDNLAAERGGETIFSGLSVDVAAGEALLVRGPNGVGKSTLLRVLCGLLPSLAGRAFLQIDEEKIAVSCLAHYLGHGNAMKNALSVDENLRGWKAFQNLSDNADHSGDLSVEESLEMVGLAGIGHLPFGYLSIGQKRRIAIARLLLNYRPVWLVDEPTAGLDSQSDALFVSLAEEHLRSGGMMVAVTHLPIALVRATTLDMSLYDTRFGDLQEEG